jgi:hypothetical protein
MGYTVQSIGKTREWASQQGGPMVSYYLGLTDSQGTNYLDIELAQKASSPAPQVGQVIEGNLDQGPYGTKLKKAFQGPGGGGGRSPEDRKSIVRQHSQDMALRTVELGATFGIIKAPEDSKAFLALIEWLTDHFVKDAGKA